MLPEGMTISDLVSIIALFFGPVTAVLITLCWQQYKEKRDAKMKLFMTLMSYRRAMPLNPERVTALNLIDVVFADHSKVVARWHHLYDLLHRSPLPGELVNSAHVELLSEMASALKFRLPQVDINKYYYPLLYEEQLQEQAEMQQELLRVLKNTERVVFLQKPDGPKT